MKKILSAVLFLVCLGASSVQAQSPVKIGHASTSYVLEQLPDLKKIQGELETTRTQLEKVIQEKAKVFEEKYEKFQKNAPSMSEVLLTDSQKELEKLRGEIEQLQQTSEITFRNKQNQLFQPVLEKIDKAVKEVAKENGYLYVINSDTGNTGNPVILFSATEDTDITKLVLKKLGVTEVKTPAPATKK